MSYTGWLLSSGIFSLSRDLGLIHSPRIRFGLVALACSVSPYCTQSSWLQTVWCCCSMHPFCPLSDFLIISCCTVVDLMSHILLHPRTLDCRQRLRFYCLIIFKSPRPKPLTLYHVRARPGQAGASTLYTNIMQLFLQAGNVGFQASGVYSTVCNTYFDTQVFRRRGWRFFQAVLAACSAVQPAADYTDHILL